jgi:hypothetical protein
MTNTQKYKKNIQYNIENSHDELYGSTKTTAGESVCSSSNIGYSILHVHMQLVVTTTTYS